MAMMKTVPPEIREEVRKKKVVLAGFGAGPGFAAQKTEEFSPPADFDSAMAWLERYGHVLKRARLDFEDGSRMFFHGAEFDRYESTTPASEKEEK